MAKKSILSLLAATAMLFFSAAYAVGDQDEPTAPDATTADPAAPAEQSTQRTLTRKEAVANGVPEAVFDKADTNKDEVLDAQEIAAYNAKAGKAR